MNKSLFADFTNILNAFFEPDIDHNEHIKQEVGHLEMDDYDRLVVFLCHSFQFVEGMTSHYLLCFVAVLCVWVVTELCIASSTTC